MKRGRLHIPGGHPMTAKQFLDLYYVIHDMDPMRAKRKIKPHEVTLVVNYAMEITNLLARLGGELVMKGFIIRQPGELP